MTDLQKALDAYLNNDFEATFNLLQPLAEGGDPVVQFWLGILYYNGEGVRRDFVEAVRLYTLSAEQRYVGAQNALAVCYRNGLGVEKNNTEAFTLLNIAANRGFKPAQFNLGLMYECGADGAIETNLVLAYMWISLSALEHNEWRNWIRDWISRNMEPRHITEAETMAQAFVADEDYPNH